MSKLFDWLCHQVYALRYRAYTETLVYEMDNAPWTLWVLVYDHRIERRLAWSECKLGALSRPAARETVPPF